MFISWADRLPARMVWLDHALAKLRSGHERGQVPPSPQRSGTITPAAALLFNVCPCSAESVLLSRPEKSLARYAGSSYPRSGGHSHASQARQVILNQRHDRTRRIQGPLQDRRDAG